MSVSRPLISQFTHSDGSNHRFTPRVSTIVHGHVTNSQNCFQMLSDIRYRKTCDLKSYFVLGVGTPPVGFASLDNYEIFFCQGKKKGRSSRRKKSVFLLPFRELSSFVYWRSAKQFASWWKSKRDSNLQTRSSVLPPAVRARRAPTPRHHYVAQL